MILRRRHGFTLVELLVVIAIIAVLAAIIFPVFASAMERGRMATCQSNLRQIGIAIDMYTQDYDGLYPCTGNFQLWMGRYWRWPLKPYMALSGNPNGGNLLKSDSNSRNVLLCPSDSDAAAKFDGTSYSYSMSCYISPDTINTMTSFTRTYVAPGPECVPQNEASVAYPGQKIIVAEWTSNHESPKTANLWSWGGGRACLFADGHVKYLKSKQILPANDGFPDINLTHDGILGRDID